MVKKSVALLPKEHAFTSWVRDHYTPAPTKVLGAFAALAREAQDSNPAVIHRRLPELAAALETRVSRETAVRYAARFRTAYEAWQLTQQVAQRVNGGSIDIVSEPMTTREARTLFEEAADLLEVSAQWPKLQPRIVAFVSNCCVVFG